jgi:hypothetical protein
MGHRHVRVRRDRDRYAHPSGAQEGIGEIKLLLPVEGRRVIALQQCVGERKKLGGSRAARRARRIELSASPVERDRSLRPLHRHGFRRHPELLDDDHNPTVVLRGCPASGPPQPPTLAFRQATGNRKARRIGSRQPCPIPGNPEPVSASTIGGHHGLATVWTISRGATSPSATRPSPLGSAKLD